MPSHALGVFYTCSQDHHVRFQFRLRHLEFRSRLLSIGRRPPFEPGSHCLDRLGARPRLGMTGWAWACLGQGWAKAWWYWLQILLLHRKRQCETQPTIESHQLHMCALWRVPLGLFDLELIKCSEQTGTKNVRGVPHGPTCLKTDIVLGQH